MIAIRDVYDELEPLATPELDDYLNPTTLEIALADGLGNASVGRIDVQWTTEDDYKFHYTDDRDVNFRWGKHAHDGEYVHVPGLEHFHPPPDASSNPTAVEDSCIHESPPKLVTRAVAKLWRAAYHVNSLAPLNAGSNPP